MHRKLPAQLVASQDLLKLVHHVALHETAPAQRDANTRLVTTIPGS
jgi:hypothetical protein